MRAISEVLSRSSTFGWKVNCPFSEAENHPAKGVCRGTGKVKACDKCEGSGFDGKLNRICKGCGGCGAYSAAKS